MPSVVSIDEYTKAVGEDKSQDSNFAKIVDILKSISDNVKEKAAADKGKLINRQPYYTAKEVSDKISCADLERFIRKVNKEESSIKKFYVLIQKNKCGFCETQIDEKHSSFYHIFNLARLGLNLGKNNLTFKLAIPVVDITGLCLLCFDCFRNSQILYVLSHGLSLSMDALEDPINPLDLNTSPFLILPNGYITEESIGNGNNMDVMKRGWSTIHEMNLNRPQLVNKRKEAYKKIIDLLKVLMNPEQPNKPDKWMEQIFSTQLPYPLARYSALENSFGKTEARVQTQGGSFQISDFIRAYGYLEEARRHPKLANSSWRPDLLTQWNVEGSHNTIQDGFDALQKNFLCWLDEAPLQSQGYLPPHYPPLPMRPPRFIRSFTIKNYRGLTTQTICLDPPHSTNEDPDTVQAAVPVPDAAFLADNAAGKTRLLQALVWALAGCNDVEEFRKQVPDHYLPKGTIITIEFFDRPETERLEVKFPNGFPKTGQYTRQLDRKDYSSRIPVLAFGSNRAPATKPKSGENSLPPKEYFIECAMTLLRRDSHVPHPLHYLPFEKFEWFRPSEKNSQDNLKVRVIRWLLDGLLPPKTGEANTMKVHFEPLENKQNQSHDQPKAKLELNGIEQLVPFENWSEGFQTIYTLALAVIFDMMAEDSWAPPNTGLQTTMSGIVLIDEFDAHLHPRWRVQILKQMKAVFPNVQFIFTTHDPVILRGMPTSNVFRLPAPKNGRVTPTNLEEATYLTGFEIDDLLISKLFSMDMLRDEEEAEYYERYLFLLLKKAHADRAAGKPEKAEKHPKLNKTEEDELEFLRRRCGGGYAGLGHPRDQLILPVIDTIYAEYLDKGKKSSKKSGDTPDETVKKLLVEIWNR
ncbi:MAG: ATP-binding protein [Candidatus Contendobacter sp.]|nr:ATP-binding protein [Candidatus Contendobacter sp.]MDS4059099.1 ATP-binding protein [Candidatus Contendobacter sp.]